MRMLSVNIECIIYSETTKKSYNSKSKEGRMENRESAVHKSYKAALKFSKYLLEIIENGLRFLVTFYAQQA